MSYNPNAEMDYNRIIEIEETIQTINKNKIYLLNNYKYSPVGIRIERNLDNVTFTEITKDKYIEMMEHFGLENGFHLIKDKEILRERVW